MRKIKYIIATIFAISVFSGCGDSNVNGVKNGVLKIYSNTLTVWTSSR